MSQATIPDATVDNSDNIIYFRTRARVRVLQVLGIIAAVLVVVWVFLKPVVSTGPQVQETGDLAPALIPVLAAAISINLFIEMGTSVFEQNNRNMVAYFGRGLRWLRRAEIEVMRARQWLTDVYQRYSEQWDEIHVITWEINKTKELDKSVELARSKLETANKFLDLADARLKSAESNLDSLVDYPAYQRFRTSVANYFSILLGLTIATATSMQVFAMMGVQLNNPRIDMILTGLFIGGLVYPVHQVIGNLWDILTKLAKR